MLKFTTTARIRYGETDQMGYLYHGNYPLLYEIGRIETMRSIGISYKEVESKYQVVMPVVSLKIRFVRPIFYDELVEIKTSLKALPVDDMVFHTRIFNEAGEITNLGTTELCFLDANTRDKCKFPEELLQLVIPFFEK